MIVMRMIAHSTVDALFSEGGSSEAIENVTTLSMRNGLHKWCGQLTPKLQLNNNDRRSSALDNLPLTSALGRMDPEMSFFNRLYNAGIKPYHFGITPK